MEIDLHENQDLRKEEDQNMITLEDDFRNINIDGFIRTDIPYRLDHLPFSKWHWMICLSLGTSWVLDGLVISCLGLIGSRLTNERSLNLTTTQAGAIGSIYIAGAILGSIFFGIISDSYGRKRIYPVTPIIFVISTQLATWAFSFWSLAICVFFIGFGIGGEYSAINSAVNEFIPARMRGMIDIAINGSYWIGACIGAGLTVLFLNEKYFDIKLGWRFPFSISSLLAVSVVIMRLLLPESPRWLLLRGRVNDAEDIVIKIEESIFKHKDKSLFEYVLDEEEKKKILNIDDIIGDENDNIDYSDEDGGEVIKKVRETNISNRFLDIAYHRKGISPFRSIKDMFLNYRRRCFLALVLMMAQAFFYNAIFFSYALILKNFYGIEEDKIGLFEIPFCIGNFLGSIMLSPLFDKIGRKPMISSTYFISAVLLAITGFLFVYEKLNAYTQTLCWSIIFFVSSASSSSAYLTISEIFPLQSKLSI